MSNTITLFTLIASLLAVASGAVPLSPGNEAAELKLGRRTEDDYRTHDYYYPSERNQVNPNTPAPTTAPTPAPTPLPTVCTPDTSGSIGDINGNNGVEVAYHYEMVTSGGADAVASAISGLESSIALLIAGDLQIACSTRRKTKSLRERQLNSLVALSTSPEDSLSSSPCASKAAGDGETCSVVNGFLTFYSDDGTDYASQILASVEGGMTNTSSSLYSNEDITELQYFVPDPLIPSTDSGANQNLEEQPEASGDGINVAAFLGVGVAAFVLTGFFASKRLFKKDKEEESEEELEEEEGLKNEEEDEFVEVDMQVDSSNDFNESGLILNDDSILNSSGSVTVSSSFAK